MYAIVREGIRNSFVTSIPNKNSRIRHIVFKSDTLLLLFLFCVEYFTRNFFDRCFSSNVWFRAPIALSIDIYVPVVILRKPYAPCWRLKSMIICLPPFPFSWYLKRLYNMFSWVPNAFEKRTRRNIPISF